MLTITLKFYIHTTFVLTEINNPKRLSSRKIRLSYGSTQGTRITDRQARVIKKNT